MTNSDIITMRSSIHPSLMRYVLYRGTAFAIIGVILIMGSGIFLDVDFMKSWGWLIWIVSICLIAFGLIPYRKLCRLEIYPYELTIINHREGIFTCKRKTISSFPLDDISEMKHRDEGYRYGIELWFRSKKEKSSQKCDLFLPYFSQRTFNTLKQYWDNKELGNHTNQNDALPK